MLRRWWFWLGMLLVLVLISLAGIWKYFSSAIYFQRNVRPELENLLGGRPVTVGTYALTPLSAIHLKDVEVGALPDETNKTPVLTIKEMDVRYNALAMRNNRIVVSKALIESLTARIEQLPDGSFRGPFPTLVPKTDEEKDTTTTLHTKSPKKIKVKTKSKGQQYDIQNVEVRNVNIQFNQSGKAGNAPQKFALENFSLICPRFSLTEPFQIELKGKVRANNLSADIAFSPKATLKEGRIYLASASLQVEENGKPLLRVDVGLDVDPTTQSGNATLKILPTDKRFLNLAATMSGIDFHEAALAGDLQIALDKGEPSALKGMLTTTKWNPTGPNIPANLPETDWQFAFDALLGNDQSMQITSSTLLATATGHPDRALLNLNASGPVRWGKKGGAQLQLKAPCVELQPYLPALKIQPGEKAPALTITNLSTQFSCDSDQVQLKNLTAEVTGGKIAVKNFQTSLTPNPLLHWNGLEAQNVDLDTLLANVSAKHWGQLTGKGYLLSSGTACGL
ncbi:TPA: hypothetical protein DDW35_01835 [Candidatus Sumerlaeota bacterium]|nr:hypothetical protein [Candidatus Sumerlaeota bacterium]